MTKKAHYIARSVTLVLLLILISSGCASAGKGPAAKQEAKKPRPAVAPKAAPKPKPPGKPATWQQVMTFSGTGMDNTPKFTVDSNAWRVTVTGKSATPEAAFFTGYVHAKNDDPESPKDYGQIKGRGEGPVSKEFYISGTYFVHMHVENMEWTVTVEEFK